MEEQKKRLMVIDDDNIVGKIVKQRFEANGFEVEVVNHPLKAMTAIKNFSPDIILLDVVMPEVSGITLLSEIRDEYSTIELPVIMMTAKSGDDEIVEALELGASDYLVKPFNIKVGVARVNVQLKALEASKRQIEANEYKTLSSMIATYNHEINNPLTIAMGFLEANPEKIQQKHLETVRGSLERIETILSKISKLTEESKIETAHYVDNVEMISLAK